MKVGPPATRGATRPGPVSQSSTARRLLELHTPRECGEKTVQTRCQRYFQASPTDTTFKLEGENGAGRPKPSTGGTPTGVIAPIFPRKEVIQPQLPLRLPCYDFTPVTSPTFDGSLPCGLGHRLRVLLTPVV